MRQFGLIGFPLSHSFSAKYFEKKFADEHISDAVYSLFPIEDISNFRHFIQKIPDLQGFNMTIPHKVSILKHLDTISEEAKAVGAVNCVKVERIQSGAMLTGYNTDVYGFRESLRPLLKPYHTSALVLGSGGASRAVCYVLNKLGINYFLVSRYSENDSSLQYHQIDKKILSDNKLIINTTPLGMYPETDICPEIPYEFLSREHLLYDLVYNPVETKFLLKGKQTGAQIKNGLEMLELQAGKSWEIWNK